MEEERKERNYKAYVVPIVAVAIFTLLIFGAGYAYFAAAINTNVNTNSTATLPPSGTSFITSSSNDCSITVSAANMVAAQKNNYVGTSNCGLTVTLNGSAGVSCTYDVYLNTISTPYAKTAGVDASVKEFTGYLTGTASAGTAPTIILGGTAGGTQMDTLVPSSTAAGNGVKVASGTIALTADGTAVSHTYSFTENFYNIDADQSVHHDAVYQYKLTVPESSVVC